MSRVLAHWKLPEHVKERLAAEFPTERQSREHGLAHVTCPLSEIVAVASPGSGPVGAELMDALPGLKVIATFSSGVDGVDVRLANARGVAVTNAPDVLAGPVADIAVALAIDVMRGVTAGDRYMRAGRWKSEGNMPLATLNAGKTAGIYGLGRIGLAVARRLAACDMEIAYFSRRSRDDVPYRYHGSLLSLASASDLLVVCCPNSPETLRSVNADVLAALGPRGFLVNVARGSVIDQEALLSALREGRLGGAGLDVFDNEPDVDPRLFELENIVLAPHIGGAAAETRAAMFDVMFENLRAAFSGRPLPNPVRLP